MVVGRKILIGYLTPDFLVEQIERHWNCRAQIEGVRVTLLGSTTVELSGLSLAPRDDQADRRVALEDRPPLPEGGAELRSERVFLEIQPAELIKRKLTIRQLILTGLDISTRIDREGDASIERLFDRPAVRADEAVVLAASAGGGGEAGSAAAGGETMDWATVADRIEVKDGRVAFQIEASGTDILLEAFQLTLSDIDVDPADLAAHNGLGFQFAGELVVIPAPEKGEGEYLRGKVSGTGNASPFRGSVDHFDPAWSGRLTLHQGAQINTFPVIVRLQELLEEVDTSGVDLADLNVRGTLLADASARIDHEGGRYVLKEPMQLSLPDTTLVVQEGGWLHTGTNRHEVEGQMVASEALTKKIEAKVESYLKKKAKGFPAETLRELVLGPVKKEGKLTIRFTSEGDLANPRADIVTPFGNLSEVIETGKDTLKTLEEAGKSLLKNLFGR